MFADICRVLLAVSVAFNLVLWWNLRLARERGGRCLSGRAVHRFLEAHWYDGAAVGSSVKPVSLPLLADDRNHDS